jgi:lipoate-protein ligase A
VCIGFHQDVEQEVDLEFCREKGIPVFRRDLGGGAVYLDGDQLFFQIILRKDHPAVPKQKEAFYRKFLEPVIQVYQRIGIPAEYKPINDLIAGNRKISGTGAAEMGDCIVFVGNLILDFNYEMMARVLRVPDEKFRDKVHRTLVDNLSTVRRELGAEDAARWDETRLNVLLAEAFEGLLGPMEPGERDDALSRKLDELRDRMLTPEWLYQRRKAVAGAREVKVKSGTRVIHRVHKAVGGLIRADLELEQGRFGRLSLSGDFFCFPPHAVRDLEARLQGRPVDEARSLLIAFYSEGDVETPGIEIDDWMQVLAPVPTG